MTRREPAVEATLNFVASRDSSIDPQDWANAVCTWLNKTYARRKKDGITTEFLLQELLISDLVNCRPWSADQIAALQKESADKKFCERFARAFARGKRPIIDALSRFILSNDSVLHPELAKLLSKRTGERDLPGLREWHPQALLAPIRSAHQALARPQGAA